MQEELEKLSHLNANEISDDMLKKYKKGKLIMKV